MQLMDLPVAIDCLMQLIFDRDQFGTVRQILDVQDLGGKSRSILR
jgi:hypothetical protein